MKLQIIFFFMFCGMFSGLYAQSVVSGRVMDKASKTPMDYTSVSVLNNNGSMLTGVITGTDGRFTVTDLKKGTYTFLFSYIGYHSDSLTVAIGEINNIYDIGDIMLAENVALIGEVVITGRADIVSGRLEKKTYSLQDNIS
ncbi:carboxypeptidase-like regulatory domain-containing protein, partial [Parabacteroides sp. OttesenSCG-928-K15]|nr:carboxypeptidase-like regulatory domain-containing protein [Parabacteroides sp. OttesenSCG-928-K15]